MSEANQALFPQQSDTLWLDGELVTVVAVVSRGTDGTECVLESPSQGLVRMILDQSALERARVHANDGQGDSRRALLSLWGKWMESACRRIRNAVLATKPLRPYAHQDEAVFAHMLSQPRLRFLLADEPGTGKTIMAGMYLAEGRRRGLIPGKVVVICPAHLVSKWIRDLRRYFGIEAKQVTSEIGREPQDLRPDIDVWVVSLDLFTHNTDVNRKVTGATASWSVAIFDEAHRLTPTSQYLDAARQAARKAHHLLLLTATPHRGKEHYFRGLVNLLEPSLYPFDERVQDYHGQILRPSELHFLRRMKEELVDLDGNALFPPRSAETKAVHLTGLEADAYEAVMRYVDEWYLGRSTLARSVYGKRAASSTRAVFETLKRRRDILEGGGGGRSDRPPPLGFDQEDLGGASLDDDAAWEDAERTVVESASRDRRGELAELETVMREVQGVIEDPQPPSKWEKALEVLEQHDIRPGSSDQLLVFTEFSDTARWLRALFADAGFTAELLEGSTDHRGRDELQERFLAGRFQVLVSTDAGGEGIDLQSANVMINWDIPWSLVRLEQRMGRLHRIGQTREVFIYHLVAPQTREGRVQEVMLANFGEAGKALRGRIFDLLDVTIDDLGFDYARALAEAHRSRTAGAAIARSVPDVEALVARAQDLVEQEDRLRTPTNLTEANARFAADRLEAINPVIVEAFIRQLAATEGLAVRNGPATGILILDSRTGLPAPLRRSGANSVSIAADAAAVEGARQAGAHVSDVVVLGPTEEVFRSLATFAATANDADLRRGTMALDTGSLTDYTVFAFVADMESHDGIRRERGAFPFLVRFSGEGAFPVGWELLMKLHPSTEDGSRPHPAARQEAEEAAQRALNEEIDRLVKEKEAWVAKAQTDLEDIEGRYHRQIRSYPEEVRRGLRDQFSQQKEERLRQLARLGEVAAGSPRLIGWIQVRGGARREELGWDPDSEWPAIAAVLAELTRQGFAVDDRQTAGLGYDLFARNPRTGEQRLVEVKGKAGELQAVTLEQNEWAQAQQRGSEYWLYVVINCQTNPEVVVRVPDPAGRFAEGRRLIERFQIPVSKLREVAENP